MQAGPWHIESHRTNNTYLAIEIYRTLHDNEPMLMKKLKSDTGAHDPTTLHTQGNTLRDLTLLKSINSNMPWTGTRHYILATHANLNTTYDCEIEPKTMYLYQQENEEWTLSQRLPISGCIYQVINIENPTTKLTEMVVLGVTNSNSSSHLVVYTFNQLRLRKQQQLEPHLNRIPGKPNVIHIRQKTYVLVTWCSPWQSMPNYCEIEAYKVFKQRLNKTDYSTM